MVARIGALSSGAGAPTGSGSRLWRVGATSPAMALLVFAYLFPVLLVLPEMFENDRAIEQATSSTYLRVTWTTIRISLWTTVVTLLVAYPLAWMIAHAKRQWIRVALGLLVLVPFLTSVLVRTFSWVVMLGRQGLLNRFLEAVGVIDEPLNLLFTQGAVVTALVHVSVPLMVLALVPVMRTVDPNVIRVAETLGASRRAAFTKVVVPMTREGIRSGAILVFLFSMATFIAPAVLGSRHETMLGQVIQNQVENSFNWALASAISVELAIAAVLGVGVISIVSRIRRPPMKVDDTAVLDGVDEARPRADVRRDIARHSANPLSRTLAAVGDLIERVGRYAYLPMVAVYLLLPLVVLIPLSFSSNDTLVFPPQGYGLSWYDAVLEDPTWREAAFTSLRIGVGVAVVSTALATLLVLGLGRTRGLWSRVVGTSILAPVALPAVVFALGIFLAYGRVFAWTDQRLRLTDSTIGIGLAHTVLVLPLAFVIVSAVYATVRPDLEQAARSLGASRWRVIRHVTLPLMAPGIATAMILAFLNSFDESVTSLFLSSLRVRTLPRLLWDGVRFGTTPEVAVVSVLLLCLTAVVVVSISVLWLVWQRRLNPSTGTDE